MILDNLIINHVVRGTYFDRATNDVLFTLDKIQDPSLELSGEQAITSDHLGAKIAEFDRAKDATFSGSNAILNLGLMAAQFGAERKDAAVGAEIEIPAFELIEVTDPAKITLTLNKDDNGVAYETVIEDSVKFIYGTTSDKSRDEKRKYAKGATVTATEFTLKENEISLPTDAFKVGDIIAIWYEKKSTEALEIVNSAKRYTKSGKFVLEVLAVDPCQLDVDYYLYVIFNNAKVDNNTTINFTNESAPNFTIKAIQDYCSLNNDLCKIVVAE